jgi:hypothetical protein
MSALAVPGVSDHVHVLRSLARALSSMSLTFGRISVLEKSSSRGAPGAKRRERGGTLRFALNYDFFANFA